VKLWIKTQNKKKVLLVDNITIRGKSLRVLNQQYPFGLLIGKYENPDKAQTVLDSICSKLKTCTTQECVFEMPDDY